MEDKILKTKIALLYKTYAQWDAIKATYIPLKGEVCICEVPASTGAVVNEPAVLIKVGDGTKAFANLPWISANAADVYAWAKKANLDFQDLDATFLEALDARIAEKSENVEYQVADAGNGVWKLQKREIGAQSWTDVSSINVANYVQPLIAAEKARAEAEEAKKVDKEVVSASGKALIFNESDGGGAKFENADGTWSYAGVNNGGKNGIAAQLYAVDSTANYKGAKLDVTTGGMYYTTGDNSLLPAAQRDVADNELVVKKDIKDLAGGMHFIGVGEWTTGSTVEQMAKAIYEAKGKSYDDRKAGDLIILKDTTNDREFIYDGTNWVELGDQGLYATKAELTAEAGERASADATLQTNIDAEATARAAADAALQSGKLDIMPGDEYTMGNAYNLPYYFEQDVQADKVVVHAKTVSLDGNKVHGDYTMNVAAATQSAAGLMSAADKVNLDKAILDGDYVILNCNFE